MPSWKKVVVSGSDATLNSLNVTNSVTASSFTGSFVGDGSGLTGITVDPSGLVTEITFNSYTSSTDNRIDSLETESGSIRTAFNSFTSSYNTGSFTGSFSGDGSGLTNLPDIFAYIGSAIITGSLTVTGSINIVSSSYGYGTVSDVDSEVDTVGSVDATKYKAAFFDYVISDGTNFRAGTVTSVWDYSNTAVSQTDVSTTDIGDTTNVTLNVILDGTLAKLQATTTGSGWDIHTLIRAI